MPGRITKKKYSLVENERLEVQVAIILAEAEKPMTISEIQQSDLTLVGYTPQKMTRVLGELIEKGMVIKTKSKQLNRMVYASLATLEKMGIDVNEAVY